MDDYLPVNEWGQLICAYSNKSKLWVSLIEKAYLKAHGGYDFDGSNSSRDLFVLTGWLPEIIKLKEYDREKLWAKRGYPTGIETETAFLPVELGLSRMKIRLDL